MTLMKIYTLLEKLKPSFSIKKSLPEKVDENQLMINNLSKLEQEEKIKLWITAMYSGLRFPSLHLNIRKYTKELMYFNRQMRLNLPISTDRVKTNVEEIYIDDFYVDQETSRYIVPGKEGFGFISSVKEFIVLRQRTPDQFKNESDKHTHFRNFNNTENTYSNLKKLADVLEEL